MLDDLGAAGRRLGVEFDAYGLTYANGLKLAAALDGVVELVDASRLVPALRVDEVGGRDRLRARGPRALSDAADAAGDRARSRAGADEGEILAAQHAAIFGGGGEYPGNEFIIGSGRDALLCRYKAGRRKLDADDQITLEFAGVYRHYHAAIMRTPWSATPRPLHRAYHAAAREALLACEAELRPGPHRRRRLRRPCPRARRAWPRGPPAECLRLLPRRQVHAVLDGRAHVL